MGIIDGWERIVYICLHYELLRRVLKVQVGLIYAIEKNGARRQEECASHFHFRILIFRICSTQLILNFIIVSRRHMYTNTYLFVG